MASALTKTKLIARVSRKVKQLSLPRDQDLEKPLTAKDVELALNVLIDGMANTLVEGGRIEVRGFGSFSLHFRAPRQGRNPRTGGNVTLAGKYVPHFKCGKELRDRVNLAMQQGQGIADDADEGSGTANG